MLQEKETTQAATHHVARENINTTWIINMRSNMQTSPKVHIMAASAFHAAQQRV
jgi:hypothetical protein